MTTWVDIEFDCIPLRSLPRVDVPMDASPALEAKLLRIRQAIQVHGSHNTYYLHNATCQFHLTNHPSKGTVTFSFEGTVFTDEQDLQTIRTDLVTQLESETCDWLNQAAVEWLRESVAQAVQVEFNRYIEAGSLEETRRRLAQLEHSIDNSQGFVGMYL